MERKRAEEHRLASRDAFWANVRAALTCIAWCCAGLVCMAWGLHTTDPELGQVAWKGGMVVGYAGILFTVVRWYSKARKRGDVQPLLVEGGVGDKFNRMSWLRLTLQLAGRGLVSPSLAADLLRVAWRFRARGWYARFPFLPLPSTKYVRWRMHTAYGDHDIVPPVDDVVRYARWVGRGE